MPATFEPAAPVGHDVNAAISGIEAAQSMMSRAQAMREREQIMLIREQEAVQNQLLFPVKKAAMEADVATSLMNLKSAERQQQMKAEAAPLILAAREEFNSLMKITDAKAKADAALNWSGKYSQLSNIKEISEEFKRNDEIAKELWKQNSAIALAQEQARLREMGPDSPIGKMVSDYDKARAAGKSEAADFLLAGIKEAVTPKGMQLEVGPDGGIRFFQGAGGMTTANTTKSEERQYQQERLIREGGQLLNILRPEDLGVQGNIGETAGGFLGQIDPGLAKAQVAENRSRLRAFKESALRAVSDDSRFSNADRKAIEQMLPSDGWFENLPQAKGKLKAVITILSQRAISEAKRQGKKSWTELPPEELVQQAREGKIDKDAAAAILDALHPDWVKEQVSK